MREKPQRQSEIRVLRNADFYNLEFHYKDAEAPQERLCVLCAFVV